MQDHGRKEQRVTAAQIRHCLQGNVLKMVSSGQSVAYVSRALGVSENLIYRWRQKSEEGNKEGNKAGSSSLSAENEQLRERVRQLETERDI